MLQRVFPTSLDNQFPGHKIALYVFYALTALTLWRSQHHLFGHDGGAQSIASIPLDTYSSNAADTVIGVFALWGLFQLIIGLIYLLAAIRYRALILCSTCCSPLNTRCGFGSASTSQSKSRAQRLAV